MAQTSKPKFKKYSTYKTEGHSAHHRGGLVHLQKLFRRTSALLFTKVGQTWQLSVGGDLSAKELHLLNGFSAAFSSFLPSFHPIDLYVGVAAAVIIRLIVYFKGKNAKKL